VHQKWAGWFSALPASQDAASALAEYDAELEAEGFTAQLRLHAEGSDNSNKEGGTAGGGRCLFLDIVVGWLLDSNRDGRVDKSELYRLQLLGDELSMLPELVAEGVSRPRTMLQLLDVLYEGFDRSSLLSVATAAAVGSSEAADSQGPASTGAIDIAGATGTQQQQQQQDKSGPLSPITAEQVVLEGLGVTQVLASYNTAALLDDYVSGSRQWMFDRVMAWLDQRPQEGGSTASSRMFLLLAGMPIPTPPHTLLLPWQAAAFGYWSVYTADSWLGLCTSWNQCMLHTLIRLWCGLQMRGWARACSVPSCTTSCWCGPTGAAKRKGVRGWWR
jgi:hypothetical protein